MTSQIITNEYANDEFMDKQFDEMNIEIAMFVNNLISKEQGQGEACHPNTVLSFLITNDNVSVKTEGNKDIYVKKN